MNLEAEHFLKAGNTLGEGPVWSVQERALYWVDILNDCFKRFYTETGKFEVIETGVRVGTLAFRASGGLILATSKGIAFWDAMRGQLDFRIDPENGNLDMRFNDGKVDPQGRFWAGSMYYEPEVGKREGSLYRFDPDGSLHKMETHLAIPNGIAWSADNKTMYHTDSLRHAIYAYDFDPATGNIENKRIFIDTSEEPGVPDGMTMDCEGCLWSARWGAWKVVRYDPKGKKILEISLPVEQPTSCIFGGENMDELFITTAREHFTEEQARQQPLAGDIFVVRPGIQGMQEPMFAG
ncbi:MAG TPA: SMP-30/gluconolactonase/LRE family protein [Chloroflexia bacterium]|nr:SMP-30/gluconolactonase/LRE family protein [Chloroflexia bacterium]